MPPKIPDIVHWVMLDFPYFGTIGNTKYEEQTKRNRIALKARLKDVLGNEPIPTAVSLHFQLTSQRRERDLDNLADAPMPFFNMHIPSLSSIQLSKAEQLVRSTERLWLSAAFTPRADEGQ